MKATLKNYRQSPRKVRLIAGLVRGKRVKQAKALLRFAEQRAAEPFSKVLDSAVANAVQAGKSADSLFIKKITIDQGVTYRRFMPRARGAASPINRRSSHINIELAEQAGTKEEHKSEAGKKQTQNA